MKYAFLTLALTLAFSCFGALPTTITLTNKVTLTAVQPIKWSSLDVTIKHSRGVDPIQYRYMAPESRKAFEAQRDIELGLVERSVPQPASALKVASDKVSGCIYVATRGGDSKKLGDVEVLLVDANEFRRFDEGRSLSAARVAYYRYKGVGGNSDSVARSLFSEYEQSIYNTYDGHPKPLAKARTDADGNYSIDVPNYDTVLFVRAERVGRVREYYVWIIPVTAGEKVNLSNSNMIDTQKIGEGL